MRTTVLQCQDGLLKVGGQEEDQKLLGEGQSRKSETKLGGRAWKYQRGCTKLKALVRQRGSLMRLLS